MAQQPFLQSISTPNSNSETSISSSPALLVLDRYGLEFGLCCGPTLVAVEGGKNIESIHHGLLFASCSFSCVASGAVCLFSSSENLTTLRNHVEFGISRFCMLRHHQCLCRSNCSVFATKFDHVFSPVHKNPSTTAQDPGHSWTRLV
jgi:hypothetical protein